MPKTNKTILVVEDEKSLAFLLEQKINQEGLTASTAKDGKEGLMMALKDHPDLILLDIIMPKMNGVKMLEKLREDEWGKSVPVLLLTNVSNPDDIRESLKNNATDYLIKSDWQIEDVINKVKSTLKLS